MNSAKAKKGLTITDFFQKIKKMDRNKNIPKEDSEVVEAIVDLTIDVEAKVIYLELYELDVNSSFFLLLY